MGKATLYNWNTVEEDRFGPGLRRRFVTGDAAMVARWEMSKGEIVPEHSHDNEQIAYIVSGALRFVLDGKDELITRAGDVLVIPANVKHSAEVLEDCVAIDVFSPPRQDWLDKTDAYLREQVTTSP